LDSSFSEDKKEKKTKKGKRGGNKTTKRLRIKSVSTTDEDGEHMEGEVSVSVKT